MPYHFIHLISLAFTQTIPHSKLKARLKELAQSYFIKHNDQNRYKCLVWERWNLFYEKHNSLKLILWKCSSLRKTFLICYAWYKYFSTNCRLFYEYQLCSPSHWPVPLFVRNRFHTVTSKEKKELAWSLILTLHYIDDTLHYLISSPVIILIPSIQINLK
jgi:hypothetical protein